MSIAMKVLGIYAFINSIPLFGSLFSALAMYRQGGVFFENNLYLIGGAISFLLMFGAGCVLVIFSDSLAKRVCGPGEFSSERFNISDLQSVAFSVTGLLIAILAIPDILLVFSNLYAKNRAAQEGVELVWKIEDEYVFAFSTAVQFILGIILFFGGKGLSNLLQRTRGMRPD
ncbi:MAG: hypothetical protein HYV24_08350 [Deltaproteobacteria bacterium]|nr:hypothetical protein [Deltaproteobacteria bacterium]